MTMTDTAATFEAFITAERERLGSERDALQNQMKELEEKPAAIDDELKAITAYETVKAGKPVSASVSPAPASARKPRDPDAPKRTRTPRAESEALRQQILDVVRGREGGADAADLYAFLERDDEKGKQAVNAALMALKREGAIRQAGRRQPYTAVEHPQADEAGLTSLTCPSRVASTPPPGYRPSPSPSPCVRSCSQDRWCSCDVGRLENLD